MTTWLSYKMTLTSYLLFSVPYHSESSITEASKLLPSNHPLAFSFLNFWRRELIQLWLLSILIGFASGSLRGCQRQGTNRAHRLAVVDWYLEIARELGENERGYRGMLRFVFVGWQTCITMRVMSKICDRLLYVLKVWCRSRSRSRNGYTYKQKYACDCTLYFVQAGRE